MLKSAIFLMTGQKWRLHFMKSFTSSEFVRNSLTQSRFVVNQEKSAWCPTTNMTCLGINLDFDKKNFLYISFISTITNIIQSPPYTLLEH